MLRCKEDQCAFECVKAAVYTFICLANKLYIVPNVKAQMPTGSICVAGTIFISENLFLMWQVHRSNEHKCVCVCEWLYDAILKPIFICFFA